MIAVVASLLSSCKKSENENPQPVVAAQTSQVKTYTMELMISCTHATIIYRINEQDIVFYPLVVSSPEIITFQAKTNDSIWVSQGFEINYQTARTITLRKDNSLVFNNSYSNLEGSSQFSYIVKN